MPDHTGEAHPATGGPSIDGRVGWNDCPVPALPLTHSPEEGSQRCQIIRGVPTPNGRGLGSCPSRAKHTDESE